MKKLNTTLKRRNFITFLTVFLVSIYVCTAAVSVSAASRNVTKNIKRQLPILLAELGLIWKLQVEQAWILNMMLTQKPQWLV